MKTTLQILMDAKAIIETPEAWTKDSYHSGEWGEPDCKYCMIGALHLARGENWVDSDDGPDLRLLERVTNSRALQDWNDAPERTHAEVLAAFDEAIERARTEAALS